MKVQPLTNPIPAGVLALSLCFCPMESPADYVNTYTINGITWHLSADSVTGTYYSDSANWPENVSVVFTDVSNHMFDWGVIYYNMTLTDFGYSSSGHGTDISVPAQIEWDSGGSDGVESGPLQFIASDAFYDKDSITSVNIPSTILGIRQPCFLRCSNLEAIHVFWDSLHVVEISNPSDATKYSSRYVTKDGVLYNADMTKLLKYPEGKTDRFFVVPETVTELAPYCFANTKLVAVQFLGDCPTVDSTSFSGSSCVVYRYDDTAGWPEGSYGWDEAWTGTDATVCSIPQGGERVFDGQTNRYTIVNGVLYRYLVRNGKATLEKNRQGSCIPSAFSGSVALPSEFGGFSLGKIGEEAFSGCSELTSITIPVGVSEIGQSAFAYCYHLTSITIPDGVKSIGGWAFYDCGSLPLPTVVIPDSVTHIGSCAFSGSSVMAFSVGENNPVYSSQNGLLLTKDGKTIIAGVNGDVIVPGCVTAIGEYAFYYLNTISVTIPNSVKRIDESAFYGCWKIESIVVAEDNPCYSSSNGLLLSKNGRRLIAGVNGDVTIPEGVTTIDASAFVDRLDLTSVSIPESVTNIGAAAFSQCRSLTSVVIPSGVTTLEDRVFDMCSSLASITIPNGITRIGEEAFFDCCLSSMTIPDSVGSIGKDVFRSCDVLREVSIPYAFKDVTSGWGLPDSCVVTIRNPLPLEVISAAALPRALSGGVYKQTLIARGGLQPYLWEIVNQSEWPEWLWSDDLPNNGVLSGWPSDDDIGTYSFTLRVSDAAGTSVEKTFTLEVVENPNHAPVIESWTPDAKRFTVRVGETIVFSMEASDPDGDELNIGWQLEDENGEYLHLLPIDEFGNCTFTADEEGLFEVWCWASDGFHNSSPAHSWQLSVVSADAPLVSTAFPHAVEGVYYETQLSATGGTAPYTWAMAGDSEDWIDAWLDEDGLFEWTSGGWESNRYHQFPVTVTDAEGRSSTQWISIYLESNPNERPVIDSVTPQWGYDDGSTSPIGKEIVFSVEAHDPEGEPLMFMWEFDDEPIETSGPSWTWTPGAADNGKHRLSVRCSDGERESWWQWWYFEVVSTNVLRTAIDLPTAVVRKPYSAVFSVTGGTEPCVWGGPEYEMTRETNSFAESGEAQDWAEDDESWSVSLPFSFPFYGQTYDEIWVSDNGTICLDGSFSKWQFDRGEFKSHALIAPLWADLDGALQTIYVDSSDSGQVTIRWATRHWGASSGANVIAFAATLYADGTIRFVYDGPSCYGSVGVSAGDGARFMMPVELQDISLGSGEDVVFRSATFAPGLELSFDGMVSGTPTAAGTYRIPVTVVDAEGASWSGETVLYVVEDGAPVTLTTPVPVEYAWLAGHGLGNGTSTGYEAAANAAAKNGRPVWECYVADLDPEDENDNLVADIEMVDGRPVVTILKGEKASREYETQGAPAPGGPWGKPDDGSRFFRVKVSLP